MRFFPPRSSTSSIIARITGNAAATACAAAALPAQAGTPVAAALAETLASSPDTLARLADAAHISPMWLILGRGPIEPPLPLSGALRAHPDWARVFEEAQQNQRGIPDEYWERAGDMVLNPQNLDWQLVVGVVRELYWADQRDGGVPSSKRDQAATVR